MLRFAYVVWPNSRRRKQLAAIEWYWGAMNRVRADETAFPNREAQYQLVFAGGWEEPVDDAAGIGCVRGLRTATERFALNGEFLNFNADDETGPREGARAGYGANCGRLVAIKRRYDPLNDFRENNSVVP